MSGGGSGGGSQTVTQVQQIPEFEQQFSQENQNIARSLGANPYPQYQGQLVAGFTPQQTAGMQMAGQAATAYQPDLASAEGVAANALNASPSNPGVVASYMSPYVQSSLAPQVLAAQTQLGQQQNAINAQATQANAFGDARQGVESSLANWYGDQNLAGIEANGFNNAYGNALSTAQNQQALGLQGAGTFANLGGLQQSLGTSGANALYNAGQQQQTQQQQELNTAYQQFLNQANWPYQMLNVRESALSNSPYSISNATTLPSANTTAQGVGSFAALSGALGSLFGGSTTSPNVFGGA